VSNYGVSTYSCWCISLYIMNLLVLTTIVKQEIPPHFTDEEVSLENGRETTQDDAIAHGRNPTPPGMSGHHEESCRVGETWSRWASLLHWEIYIIRQSLSRHARHEVGSLLHGKMGVACVQRLLSPGGLNVVFSHP
jgi:hypothetical protein